MAKAAARRPPPDLRKYAFATAVLSFATPLFLGYDLAMVSSTAVLADADLKLLACTVVLSTLMGSLSAVVAQCAIGDRRAVLLSAAVLSAGAVVRGLATGPAAFTAGIFVNGVGMGQALMIVPAYAAEIIPSVPRGVLASHPDGFVYLGSILGSLCYSTELLWRLTVVSGAAVLALLCSAAVLMPESPRWLVAVDQVVNARRVLSVTSATLEEADLRLLEIKAELDGTVRGRWREECAVWRDLLGRPTEPLRRAAISALVAKVFQQASGIGSMFQYVQRAFRDAGPRALAALGIVVVISFSVSLVIVELGWILVTQITGGCMHRSATAGHVTRRQEQMRRARGLSATTLLSLLALVWIALGPAQWATAVNGEVSAVIFSSFAWVYEATSIAVAHGGLLVCPIAAVLVVWLFFCASLLPRRCDGEAIHGDLLLAGRPGYREKGSNDFFFAQDHLVCS